MIPWFSFLVPPAKEFAAEMILRGRGHDVFVPFETRLKRRNRYSSRKEAAKLPIWPRHIFVRHNSDPWFWPRMHDTPLIHGVVGFGEEPAAFPQSAIDKLAVLSGSSLPTKVQALRKSFVVGDLVRMTDGAFAGQIVPVTGLKGLKVRYLKVIVEVFGSKREITVPAGYVEAA